MSDQERIERLEQVVRELLELLRMAGVLPEWIEHRTIILGKEITKHDE